MSASDDAFGLLHLAGWSLGELCCHTPDWLRWHVAACRSGVTIHGEGATQAEAWEACLEAARNTKGPNG